MKKLIFAIALAIAGLQPSAAGQEGLRVEYLGANNSLVRIDTPKRYLLLPIEEAAPEAVVNVLADTRIDRTINVHLAINRVDYLVPFDLSPYAGRTVLLDIRTANNRTNSRDAGNDACWQEIRLADTFDTANREAFRPYFHHSPQWGWMNDPNGMYFHDGVYHLYYQHNEYGSLWGNLSWGHSTSSDLIHWQAQPEAIRPGGLGLVFSGSSAVDRDNTAGFGAGAVVSMYTSCGESQMQSLAYSTDGGKSFHIYEGNPVVCSDKECRDPNFFWYGPAKEWVLILAAAKEHEMWFYTSKDLKHWTKTGTFGHGYGCQDGVWECPDMMQLPIRGTKKSKWVLICNINPGCPFGGSAAQYFVGEFDGKTFRCDTEPAVTKWMDWGKDHYATVSFNDRETGRHTVVGWMSNWQYAASVPTRQFRSANTLPRELDLFTGDDGQTYLASTPSPELTALRGKPMTHTFTATEEKTVRPLPKTNGGAAELTIDLNARSASKVHIALANEAGEQTVMTFDPTKRQFAMDRTLSGLAGFSRDFPCTTTAPTPKGKALSLRIFIDHSSIEAFETRGRFAMTNLVFPTHPYTTVSVWTDKGRAAVNEMNVYPIK